MLNIYRTLNDRILVYKITRRLSFHRATVKSNSGFSNSQYIDFLVCRIDIAGTAGMFLNFWIPFVFDVTASGS